MIGRPPPLTRRRTHPLVITLAWAIAAASRGAAPPDSDQQLTGAVHPAIEARIPEALEKWRRGVHLVETGRTREAINYFEDLQKRDPDDTCACYFAAAYQLTLKRGDDAAVLERAREVLERGIRAGESRVVIAPHDLAARYCLGAAYGLQSTDRFWRAQYLRAAFAAKRSRALMLDILTVDPTFVDCRYFAATYDYYADTLPSIIKFFKTLLFLPDGNRRRGLDGLEDVSRRGILNRLDAFRTSYLIYQRYEYDPRRMAEVFGRFHLTFPDVVDATKSLALLLIGPPPIDKARGFALYREHLGRLAGNDSEDGQSATAELDAELARALLDDLDAEGAAQMLRAVLARNRVAKGHEATLEGLLIRALNETGRHGESVQLLAEIRGRHPQAEEIRDLDRMAGAFDERSSQIYAAALEARRLARDGDPARAAALLRKLAVDYRDDPQLLFWQAENERQAGHTAGAVQLLRLVIERRPDSPAFVLPRACLSLGNLMDLQNEHEQAKTYYQLALESAGGDRSVQWAAEYYLRVPYGSRRAGS
jgi:tetratricopeptide (TPR) repeat protein